MSFYENHILPCLTHVVCSAKNFEQKRAIIVPDAQGDVLEIGMGSGLNLPYYQQNNIRKIIGLEPSAALRKRAEKTAANLDIDLSLIHNGAEDIPLGKNSIDTVLITFAMCTIPEIETALEEIRRVLKKNGDLLFCEHGLAPDTSVQRWQHRLNPLWKKLAGGCNLNRNIPELIQQAGFKINSIENQYMRGPKALSYIYRGSAGIR